RLVVERVDLDVARLAGQWGRFPWGKGRFPAHPPLTPPSRLVFERGEKTFSEAESPRLPRDPHAPVLGPGLLFELDGAAPNGAASHSRDDERTARSRKDAGVGVEATRGIETDVEAVVQLGEVLRQAPSRGRGSRILYVEPDHRRLEQSLDLRHR